MNNDSALSIRDIIKKSFLKSELFSDAMSPETIAAIVLSLVGALLLGLLIYAVYKKSFRGVVYSQPFALTLVGMCVLSCMITLAISTNVVLSIGMVGALSIVRFRTAIKEPMDLLFLFWAITTGIAAGAGMYVIALAGAALIILLLLVLNRRSDKHTLYIMIIQYYGDDIGDDIRRILRQMRYSVKSKTMRAKATELAVEVYANRNNLSFVEQIRDLQQVETVTLVQYNGEYHG